MAMVKTINHNKCNSWGWKAAPHGEAPVDSLATGVLLCVGERMNEWLNDMKGFSEQGIVHIVFPGQSSWSAAVVEK